MSLRLKILATKKSISTMVPTILATKNRTMRPRNEKTNLRALDFSMVKKGGWPEFLRATNIARNLKKNAVRAC
jgi:hypothetical protein